MSGMKRMVRVGRWEAQPSKTARKCVATFVADFFRSETVWTRRERGGYVVVAQENPDNTEEIERFRFNRTMAQRFRFKETDTSVEIALQSEDA